MLLLTMSFIVYLLSAKLFLIHFRAHPPHIPYLHLLPSLAKLPQAKGSILS